MLLCHIKGKAVLQQKMVIDSVVLLQCMSITAGEVGPRSTCSLSPFTEKHPREIRVPLCKWASCGGKGLAGQEKAPLSLLSEGWATQSPTGVFPLLLKACTGKPAAEGPLWRFTCPPAKG